MVGNIFGDSVTLTKSHHRKPPSMAYKHAEALETCACLTADCLIASTLARTNRLRRLGHFHQVSWGWDGGKRRKDEARTQLNLPQHLLLQHGLFLQDPFTCHSKISTHCHTGPHSNKSNMSWRKSSCFYKSALFLIDLLAFPLGIRKHKKKKKK